MKIIANVNLEKTCQATDLPANIQYANELKHVYFVKTDKD